MWTDCSCINRCRSPMVLWITRTFGKALSAIGEKLGMDENGSAGLVATLANNIAMFNIMDKMNPKGKLLNVAFAVSAAFVFGDHLGFTGWCKLPDMIIPGYALVKLRLQVVHCPDSCQCTGSDASF